VSQSAASRPTGPADDGPATSAAADRQTAGADGPMPDPDGPTDPIDRAGITDSMAAELAGWAAGELPGQASARLAAWTTVGGAVARGRHQADLGGGGTAAERVS
jgi:hypothetical protein